jgi:hypothetical protein
LASCIAISLSGQRRPGRDLAAEIAVRERGDQPPRRQRCRRHESQGDPGERSASHVGAPESEREEREDGSEDHHGDEMRDRERGQRYSAEQDPAPAGV